MMHTVTKATDIQFIDGKCHIMKRKSLKTALSSYYICVSHDLLLMASEWTHIHTHNRQLNKNDFKKPGTRPLIMRAWFKNCWILMPKNF